MKPIKFWIFAITVLVTSVVVFNNFTDVIEKLFHPGLSVLYFFSLGMLTIPTMMYIVYNL